MAARKSKVPHWVNVEDAQKTTVGTIKGLLTDMDCASIEKVVERLLGFEDPVSNNNQNAIHENKMCLVINKTSGNNLVRQGAPLVLAKIMHFAKTAVEREGWAKPGMPLHNIRTKPEKYEVRTVERWRYEVGGSLVDELHFDHGSLLTLVVALDDGYEGGIFRTFEADGTHAEHHMNRGDAVCFLSHKYHNVTPVTKGRRHSMVIELWEGK